MATVEDLTKDSEECWVDRDATERSIGNGVFYRLFRLCLVLLKMHHEVGDDLVVGALSVYV